MARKMAAPVFEGISERFEPVVTYSLTGRHMKNCAYCGRENKDDAAQCCGCGTAFVTELTDAPDHPKGAPTESASLGAETPGFLAQSRPLAPFGKRNRSGRAAPVFG
jgi:hypothetical protein